MRPANLYSKWPKCYAKDAEILKLKDQLAELKKQQAVWEEKESLCKSFEIILRYGKNRNTNI